MSISKKSETVSKYVNPLPFGTLFKSKFRSFVLQTHYKEIPNERLLLYFIVLFICIMSAWKSDHNLVRDYITAHDHVSFTVGMEHLKLQQARN